MELYIHIPFCVKKCNYCDFLSFPGYGCDADERHRSLSCAYVNALCRELDAVNKVETDKKNRIDTCFIGGGTPSVLGLNDTEKMLDSVRKCINSARGNEASNIRHSDTEFTIECNPGTLNREKLLLYRKYGANRLSIGLQSADNKILKVLGRIHTFEEFTENYKLARSLGFNNINIDLISAVPEQTIDNWKDTLKKVIELAPEHISAYSLIIEEGTPLYRKYETGPDELKLPDEETEREIYYLTKRILQENGYHQYEISNYALDGYECKHNIGYWTGEEYVGVGLGASSYLSPQNAFELKMINPDCSDEITMLRIKNTEDMDKYLEYPNLEICRAEELLDKNALMSEFCILGLRMNKGISKAQFRKRFGADIKNCFWDIINKYIINGLLEECGDIIRFTEKGRDLSNIVLCEFI